MDGHTLYSHSHMQSGQCAAGTATNTIIIIIIIIIIITRLDKTQTS